MMATDDRGDLEREKLEALAEFAAGAGHEINNPLAVISGRAQLLLRDESDPGRRRDLAIIHVQAMRIRDMIADLMLFARPPSPRRATCDAAAIVTGALESLQPKAEALEVRLIPIGSWPTVEIDVDADQIRVACEAVIDNGLNAVRRGGEVRVELRSTDDGVEIVVADDGPGISAEVRRHLFDPFYSGREAGRGLGVGLSKAWRIVTNHGGAIVVDSPVESGATFTIRLRAKPQAMDSA